MAINNKTWTLVFSKALPWGNDLLPWELHDLLKGQRKMNQKKSFLKVLIPFGPGNGGRVVLRPTDNSDTFLQGPAVTRTQTKQREERKVHGAKPSKMVA